jgi:hypothetical protein
MQNLAEGDFPDGFNESRVSSVLERLTTWLQLTIMLPTLGQPSLKGKLPMEGQLSFFNQKMNIAAQLET